MQSPIKVLEFMYEGLGSNRERAQKNELLKLSRFLKEPRVKSYIKIGKQNKHMQIVQLKLKPEYFCKHRARIDAIL